MLAGAEEHAPYDRPPLSKDCLQGKTERDAIVVHEPDWYAAYDVDLRTSAPATHIDRDAHQVHLVCGQRLGYDKLLLATDSTPRTPR